MSRYKKFLGDLEVIIKTKDKEGKEIAEKFVIKPTMEDRLDLFEKSQIKDPKEKMRATSEVFFNIFKRSPREVDETDEDIREFVDRYYLEIMKQVTIAFGWTTEEQIQRQMDAATKKQLSEGQAQE